MKENSASKIYVERANMINSYFLAALTSKSIDIAVSYAKESMTDNESKVFISVRDAMQKLNDEMRQEFLILDVGE